MFINKTFWRTVLQSDTNPEVPAFWQEEYLKRSYKGAFNSVAPIANKLGGFLPNPVVKNALCSPEHPLRLRQIMDDAVPLIVNFSMYFLGPDVSGVHVCLTLSMIAGAALIRQS